MSVLNQCQCSLGGKEALTHSSPRELGIGGKEIEAKEPEAFCLRYFSSKRRECHYHILKMTMCPYYNNQKLAT